MSPATSSSHIAIVGGGWSGLAAAVWLARKGASITLYEANRGPGGRARRVGANHLAVDNGQHILLGAYTETLNMLETIAPGSTERHFIRIPLTLHFPGLFHLSLPKLPSPLNLLLGFLAARGLNLKTKWAVATLINEARSARSVIPSNQTVSQLLAGQPQEAINFIWAPLCLSALNTPLDRASADVFVNVLRAALTGPRSHSDMLLPRNDLTRIFPMPAIEDIQQHGGKVEMGTRITRITREPHRITLESDNKSMSFGKLILACAPYHTAQLLAPLEHFRETSDKLGALRYQPIVTAYLDYPEGVGLPSPFIGLSDEAAQFAFDLGQTHGHAGRLAVVVSADHPVPEGGREGRIRHIHDALEKILGPLPRPTAWQIIEEKRATFECSTDLQRPDNETEDPNIYLAGDYTRSPYPATLEGSVRSGVQCAQLIWGKA
ncbi:MAG: hydroxysqualene dehydroxylase HpnE [Thiobacillaceae bacterium]